MALPLSLSGIDVSFFTAGPFKSSGGNFYFFGRDGTTGTTLQAYKATDPSSSFSSIDTETGYATGVGRLAATQNADIIHIAILDGTDTAQNLKYIQFDMASDVFQTAETVHSGFNPTTSGLNTAASCSIVFRGSDSQPIILYNGPRVSNMGSSYARVVYARRTGAATWTTNVAVDAGGTVNYRNTEAVLGSSDRTHFFWYVQAAGAVEHRALNSANALQTASTAAGGLSDARILQAVSYDSAGTQKIAVIGSDGTNCGCIYFDSADTVTLNVGTEFAGTEAVRLFYDGTDVWALYRKASDSDLYVQKSTDHGATFSGETKTLTGTVAAEGGIFSLGTPTFKLSVDGAIYQRGSNVVIPYVINDNGTLKYNEYVVRTVSSNKTLAIDGGSYAVTGQNVTLALGRAVAVDAGSYGITGQDVTLTHGFNAAVEAGSYAVSGQAVSLTKTWLLNVDAGSYAVTGQDVALSKGLTVAADAGSYAVSGQDVALAHAWAVPVDAGSYAVSGQNVALTKTWLLNVDAGSYSVSGQDVALNKGLTLSVEAGSYSVTGQDVALSHGRAVSVDSGSYSVSGQNVALTHDWTVPIDAGSYAVTGQDVTLTKTNVLSIDIDAGSYAVSGQDVTLTHAWTVSIEAGSYAVSGQDVALAHGYAVAIDAGSYSVTGQDVTLTHAWSVPVEAGSYAITGQDVTLTKLGALTIGIDSGTYALAGQDVTLSHGRTVAVDAGAYAISGTDASLEWGREIAADLGSFVVSGTDVALVHTRILFADPGAYTLSGTDVMLIHGIVANDDLPHGLPFIATMGQMKAF